MFELINIEFQHVVKRIRIAEALRRGDFVSDESSGAKDNTVLLTAMELGTIIIWNTWNLQKISINSTPTAVQPENMTTNITVCSCAAFVIAFEYLGNIGIGGVVNVVFVCVVCTNSLIATVSNDNVIRIWILNSIASLAGYDGPSVNNQI
ncbi:hypothetical protein ACTFIY_010504 [Dictyostelium cf. discoideum]